MTKAEATGACVELAKRMGNGWQCRVWDNCGWNYSVFKCAAGAQVNVYPRISGYYAMLSERGEVGQRTEWSIDGDVREDPREAVLIRLKHVKQWLYDVTQVVNGIEQICEELQ